MKFSHSTFDFLEKDKVELVLFQLGENRIEKTGKKCFLP